MPRLADRVKESTSTTGTGTITLSGVAPQGYQTFAAGLGAVDTLTGYCISDPSTGAWEVGRGMFRGASNDGILLLHGEGTNGGTVFTDSSQYNKTVTGAGVTTSTAAAMFGTSSLLFNGSTSYLDVPLDDDFQLGSADWTIEMFVKPAALAGVQQELFYLNGNGTGYAGIAGLITTSNTLGCKVSETGSAWRLIDETAGYGTALTTASFQHVAYVRNGANLHIFKGGVLLTTLTPFSSAGASLMTTYTSNTIGRYNSVNFRYGGYMDEIRITKGLARYTSGFSPPTAAFGSEIRTLERSQVRASSNGNALVNFGAGAKDVFITASAELLDNSNYAMFLAARGMGLI